MRKLSLCSKLLFAGILLVIFGVATVFVSCTTQQPESEKTGVVISVKLQEIGDE